jgi:hypothetical protein
LSTKKTHHSNSGIGGLLCQITLHTFLYKR